MDVEENGRSFPTMNNCMDSGLTFERYMGSRFGFLAGDSRRWLVTVLGRCGGRSA